MQGVTIDVPRPDLLAEAGGGCPAAQQTAFAAVQRLDLDAGFAVVVENGRAQDAADRLMRRTGAINQGGTPRGFTAATRTGDQSQAGGD